MEHSGTSGVLHLMFEDEWEEELSKQRRGRQIQNLAWLVVGVVIAAIFFLLQK
jgi:hypothetical protein